MEPVLLTRGVIRAKRGRHAAPHQTSDRIGSLGELPRGLAAHSAPKRRPGKGTRGFSRRPLVIELQSLYQLPVGRQPRHVRSERPILWRGIVC